MVHAAIVASATVVFIALALYGAYMAGLMDGLAEYMAVYFLKAKAKAQEAKLKSMGNVEGVDFTKAELPGNKQAENVMQEGVGGIGKGVGGIGEGVGGGLGSLKKGL